MQEIIDYITSHWGIFLTVCGGVGSVVYLKLDARYARKTELAKNIAHTDKQYQGIEHRLDKVEQDLQHLPSAEDVVELRVAVKEMKGETSALHATIKGLNRLVDLLVEKEVKGEGKQ